jgi:predicted DsbA family dithiol-disulfide isomerase
LWQLKVKYKQSNINGGNTMKVEIWSDFMCPFCYIGKRRFEAGLERFEHKDKVEVIYRSFQLDPSMEKNPSYNVHEMLAKKYSMSLEQAKAMNDNVAHQADEVGLTYHFDTMILTNTFDAHRLTHFAAQHGKGKELTELLLKAYFADSKHIGETETLLAIAKEVGLDIEEAAAVLRGIKYADEVQAEIQEGIDLGLTGVPFFVINRKHGISGAQSSEAFLEVLQKAWQEK